MVQLGLSVCAVVRHGTAREGCLCVLWCVMVQLGLSVLWCVMVQLGLSVCSVVRHGTARAVCVFCGASWYS